MPDPHYVYALIAKAICDGRPGHEVDPEDAKQIAKCIVEALADAGLQISPVGKE